MLSKLSIGTHITHDGGTSAVHPKKTEAAVSTSQYFALIVLVLICVLLFYTLFPTFLFPGYASGVLLAVSAWLLCVLLYHNSLKLFLMHKRNKRGETTNAVLSLKLRLLCAGVALFVSSSIFIAVAIGVAAIFYWFQYPSLVLVCILFLVVSAILCDTVVTHSLGSDTEKKLSRYILLGSVLFLFLWYLVITTISKYP